MKNKLRFISKQKIYTEIDAEDYMFTYNIINEYGDIKNYKITISVSGTLLCNWKSRIIIDELLLESVLLDFAKNQIVNDFKNKNEFEKYLILNTNNTYSHSYDFVYLDNIMNKYVSLE